MARDIVERVTVVAKCDLPINVDTEVELQLFVKKYFNLIITNDIKLSESLLKKCIQFKEGLEIHKKLSIS
jgi:hypothetical protein